MDFHEGKDGGYSLMEMLVILAIIGILALVGVSIMGNRQAGSVRSLMDEVDGSLTNASRSAAAVGRDVAVVTWGTWNSTTDPLVIAHADVSIGIGPPPVPPPAIPPPPPPPVANRVHDNALPILAGGVVPASVPFGNTLAVPFTFHPNDPIHGRARIALVGSGDWAVAMSATENGAKNQDLTSLTPFKSGGLWNGLITDANNPFTGALLDVPLVVSGSNKRFTTTFVIPFVGTSRNGGVLPGAAMGLIVVIGNGASIHRFYNPGIRDGDGQWRKI